MNQPIYSFPAITHIFRGILCVLLAGLLAGGHWAVFQGIAWSRMAADYMAAYGVVQGLKANVSGEKPCAMCDAIARSRTNEGRAKGPFAPNGFDYEAKPAAHIAAAATAREPEESGAVG